MCCIISVWGIAPKIIGGLKMGDKFISIYTLFVQIIRTT